MSRTEMLLRNKDVLAGSVFLIISAIVAYGANSLQLGTSLRMGPGYFPLLLSGCLAILAVLTILGGIRNASEENVVGSLALSRLVIITASVTAFILCLQGLGFPGTVFVTVLIASAASRQFHPGTSIALSLVISIGAWLIFAKLLGLPFQPAGAWLTQF